MQTVSAFIISRYSYKKKVIKRRIKESRYGAVGNLSSEQQFHEINLSNKHTHMYIPAYIIVSYSFITILLHILQVSQEYH